MDKDFAISNEIFEIKYSFFLFVNVVGCGLCIISFSDIKFDPHAHSKL